MFSSAAWTSLLTVAALAAPVAAQEHAPGAPVPLYDNLGDLYRAIATSNPLAQQYFDQGLRLTYAFNHPEAIAAYRHALALDSECAMCYWGVAWALGPNINAPMDPGVGAAAFEAIEQAGRLAGRESPVHQALIRGLATRYAADPTAAHRPSLDSAYARAMGDVAERYPDDLDAQVLHAEAVMVLSPWNYWSPGKRQRPGTATLLRRLETVIARNPNHPGACHFYIHAVEAAHPERAVPCAERLAALMPGAGHLVHMPGHIYIRVGRYLDAIRANEHAVHADETYIRDRRPGVTFYTAGYYRHNYDFLAFASAMAGRSAQSVEAAERVAALVPADLLRTAGLTFLQNFFTRHLQMRVRFGRWDEIVAAEPPADDLPFARAVWQYARGRAAVARGNLDGAQEALAALRAAAADPGLADVPLEFNAAATVLTIASEVLAGRLAAARGAFARGIEHLRRATELEDGVVYGEPPEWSVPVRHDLGAVLLAAGRPADAERVYREDLERFPDNGWSLFGLAAALTAQGKTEEAASVERKFHAAWRGADVQPTASTF